jgi:Sec-independent protein translocase protein TatA
MAILGILALLVFGEQKLPGIMRQAGRIMREVQSTSQSFVREMERAADLNETPKPRPRYEDEVQVIDAEGPGEPERPEAHHPEPVEGPPEPAEGQR